MTSTFEASYGGSEANIALALLLHQIVGVLRGLLPGYGGKSREAG